MNCVFVFNGSCLIAFYLQLVILLAGWLGCGLQLQSVLCTCTHHTNYIHSANERTRERERERQTVHTHIIPVMCHISYVIKLESIVRVNAFLFLSSFTNLCTHRHTHTHYMRCSAGHEHWAHNGVRAKALWRNI